MPNHTYNPYNTVLGGMSAGLLIGSAAASGAGKMAVGIAQAVADIKAARAERARAVARHERELRIQDLGDELNELLAAYCGRTHLRQ